MLMKVHQATISTFSDRGAFEGRLSRHKKLGHNRRLDFEAAAQAPLRVIINDHFTAWLKRKKIDQYMSRKNSKYAVYQPWRSIAISFNRYSELSSLLCSLNLLIDSW